MFSWIVIKIKLKLINIENERCQFGARNRGDYLYPAGDFHSVVWRQRREWEEKNAKHLTPLWGVSFVAYAK